MKRFGFARRLFAATALACAFVAVPVAGALVPRANGTMVYDTDLDITWIANANLAGRQMTWFEAKDWAENLNYGGFSDWRLPSARDIRTGQLCAGTVDTCVSEMGHLFKEELRGFSGATLANLGLAPGQGGLFSNIPANGYYYWLAESNAQCCNPPNDNAYLFILQQEPGYGASGQQGLIYYHQSNGKYAWAVRSGDVQQSSGSPSLTSFTDLWWNPAESGWGVDIVHQVDTLFVTIYVYGASGQPIWFVGPAVTLAGGAGSAVAFSGTLYQTSGPYFGGSFSPNAVVPRPVGTVTATFSDANAGTISYGVDGTLVSRSITRQTWRNANLGGSYLAGMLFDRRSCDDPADNVRVEWSGYMTVTHAAAGSISFVGQMQDRNCTLSNGTYTQTGSLGRVQGSFSCTQGSPGTFDWTEIQVSPSGITGAFVANSTDHCVSTGRIGLVRR